MKPLIIFFCIVISSKAFTQTKTSDTLAKPTGCQPIIIQSFSPTSATTGDTVTIQLWLPDQFTAVEFGGVPAASFTVIEAYAMVKAVVGNGASGNIKLTGTAPVCADVNVGTISGFTFVPPANLDITICDSIANTNFTSNLIGSSFQWQVSTDSVNYLPLTDDSIYNGSTTERLELTGISSMQHGYKYRCIVDGNISRIFTLRFENSWTGTSETDWSNPLNWSCGTVPGSSSNVLINQGTVILNNTVTVHSITVKPGAHLTVSTGAVLHVIH